MSPRNYCGVPPPPHASQCKLEQQACLAGKQLTARCEGQCPCPAPADSKQGEHFGGHRGFGEGVPPPEHHSTPLKSPPHPHLVPAELCTGQDLADLGERLRDWFQLLRENAKHNGSSSGPPGTGASRRCAPPSPAPPRVPAGPGEPRGRVLAPPALAAGCKEAVGWMFGRLDTSGDRYLEQPELAAINLDKYEACVRAFFNSCDASRDGRVSAAEWCFCFWRESACRGCAAGSGGCTPWGLGGDALLTARCCRRAAVPAGAGEAADARSCPKGTG